MGQALVTLHVVKENEQTCKLNGMVNTLHIVCGPYPIVTYIQ